MVSFTDLYGGLQCPLIGDSKQTRTTHSVGNGGRAILPSSPPSFSYLSKVADPPPCSALSHLSHSCSFRARWYSLHSLSSSLSHHAKPLFRACLIEFHMIIDVINAFVHGDVLCVHLACAVLVFVASAWL